MFVIATLNNYLDRDPHVEKQCFIYLRYVLIIIYKWKKELQTLRDSLKIILGKYIIT